MGETGTLRIYLGAAPGVGKTYAMLAEGRRRRDRGTDVVIGLVETHNRPLTTAMAEGLETVPRRRYTYRGTALEDLDVPAVLARRPQVALVDELAHSIIGGSGHTKRWEDVAELLAAGIDVITTLNIQHLESLAEVAAQITGVRQRETIPDAIVRRAEQIELVDMTPEALRRRMVHGNIYPPDRVDAALTHYFRPGNLTALRELALLWMADRTEEGLQAYRSAHGIAAPWETRERVLVALAGRPGEEVLVHRAARIAHRIPAAELLAVHVSTEDGLARADPERLDRLRELVESLAGTFHQTPGDDVAAELLRFARTHEATQLVIGWHGSTHRVALSMGVAGRVLGHGAEFDVHLVDEHVRKRTHRRRLRGGRRHRAMLTEIDAVRALSVSVLTGRDDLPSLLEQVRRSLALQAVSVLEPAEDGSGRWTVLASAGEHGAETPEQADATAVLEGQRLLAARGGARDPATRGVLSACAGEIQAVLSRAAAAREVREEHRHSVRTTLAVVQLVLDHEIRPRLRAAREDLAEAAKPEEADGAAEHALAEAARSLETTARRAADLADLCRLDTGGPVVQLRPVELDDVLEAVVDDLGPGGHELTIDLPDTLPDAVADAETLTRALTALIAEALRRSGAGHPPLLTARARENDVLLRLEVRTAPVPQDPARPSGLRDQSLALRLARGLVEAMAGELLAEQAEDGSGYATTVVLPAAARAG